MKNILIKVTVFVRLSCCSDILTFDHLLRLLLQWFVMIVRTVGERGKTVRTISASYFF
jgi:hypothetical protein